MDVYEDLDFEYPDKTDQTIHWAFGDAFRGWGDWLAGDPPVNFWHGLKKTAALTGTYDLALLAVYSGTCENIKEAEEMFGDLTAARMMIKMFMLIDKCN